MISKDKLRKVEVLMKDATWKAVELGQLQKDDIFKLFEPDGTLVVDDKGASLFVVQLNNSVTAVGITISEEELIAKVKETEGDVQFEVEPDEDIPEGETLTDEEEEE